ncbi:hypothetical protein BU17DRAFT_66598 [Hysterangium stoloniferum]|nr:hypothetical protein BU17DRAFT_66598 [Hysterangium stoloniferum]
MPPKIIWFNSGNLNIFGKPIYFHEKYSEIKNSSPSAVTSPEYGKFFYSTAYVGTFLRDYIITAFYGISSREVFRTLDLTHFVVFGPPDPWLFRSTGSHSLLPKETDFLPSWSNPICITTVHSSDHSLTFPRVPHSLVPYTPCNLAYTCRRTPLQVLPVQIRTTAHCRTLARAHIRVAAPLRTLHTYAHPHMRTHPRRRIAAHPAHVRVPAHPRTPPHRRRAPSHVHAHAHPSTLPRTLAHCTRTGTPACPAP